MLFFLNLDGTVTRSDTDHVYQGQNKVANVELFTLISSAQAAIQVAFTLPNGLTTTYAPMSYVGAYSVDVSNQKQVHHWKLAVPYNVTEVEGQVGVSFNVLLNDGTSGQTLETINQTTYTSSFAVEYSALPIPPTTATESELGQLLDLLDQYYAQNASLAAKQPFVVGTVNTNTLGANQQASVAVEQSAAADSNGNYPTNFTFSIPQGPTGATGANGTDGKDGVTPNISMNATVDNNVGVPEVKVTKGGTNENPSFTLGFHNIKGATGDKGETGLPALMYSKNVTTGPYSSFVTDLDGYNRTPQINDSCVYLSTNNDYFIHGTIEQIFSDRQEASVHIVGKINIQGQEGPRGPQGVNGRDGEDGISTLLYAGELSESVTTAEIAQVTMPTDRIIQVYDILISTSPNTFGAMAQVTGLGQTTATVNFIGTLQSESGGGTTLNKYIAHGNARLMSKIIFNAKSIISFINIAYSIPLSIGIREDAPMQIYCGGTSVNGSTVCSASFRIVVDGTRENPTGASVDQKRMVEIKSDGTITPSVYSPDTSGYYIQYENDVEITL